MTATFDLWPNNSVVGELDKVIFLAWPTQPGMLSTPLSVYHVCVWTVAPTVVQTTLLWDCYSVLNWQLDCVCWEWHFDLWPAGECRDSTMLGFSHSVRNVAFHKHAKLSLQQVGMLNFHCNQLWGWRSQHVLKCHQHVPASVNMRTLPLWNWQSVWPPLAAPSTCYTD